MAQEQQADPAACRRTVDNLLNELDEKDALCTELQRKVSGKAPQAVHYRLAYGSPYEISPAIFNS